jgi:hypothetical protein
VDVENFMVLFFILAVLLLIYSELSRLNKKVDTFLARWPQ